MVADQDVANALDGSSGTAALPWALAAMLYNGSMFGLSKDYAYPESANTSASRYDQITTLAKLLTRTHKHADGNSYDAFDALQTLVKWVLTQNVHINDDEKNSVNYKPTTS